MFSSLDDILNKIGKYWKSDEAISKKSRCQCVSAVGGVTSLKSFQTSLYVLETSTENQVVPQNKSF